MRYFHSERSTRQASAGVFGNERQLEYALIGTPAERLAAADHVIAHPGALNPFFYAAVVQTLWRRGDRAQATFWLYIFQSRSRAWADSSRHTADLRGSLNGDMGRTIKWMGREQSCRLAPGAVWRDGGNPRPGCRAPTPQPESIPDVLS